MELRTKEYVYYADTKQLIWFKNPSARQRAKAMQKITDAYFKQQIKSAIGTLVLGGYLGHLATEIIFS